MFRERIGILEDPVHTREDHRAVLLQSCGAVLGSMREGGNPMSEHGFMLTS